MNQLPKKILWFAPEAGLWPSAELEHELANAWVESDCQVTVIRCKGILKSYCPVMSAEGISPTGTAKRKEVACRECRFNSALMDKPEFANYSTLWLDDFVTSDIQKYARDSVSTVSQEDWQDYFQGTLPIGRYSSYLTLLHHKVPSPASHDDAWREYQSDLFNSLVVLAALPEIFDRVNPDLVAVYNPLYPTHRVFSELAKERDLPIVSITAGGYIPDRYSSIALYPTLVSSQTARDSASITNGMKEPLSALEISAVTRHVSHQILGRDPWVYSSPPSVISTQTIRAKLGLRPESPVVVVLVGSPDETRSSELVDAEFERTKAKLSDVLEFIEQALKVAHAMSDVDFVIRLHPRMLANKRENLDSPDLVPIFQALELAPANVHLNQSGDGIGLYDVARIASVGMNHASTSGLELLLLGIPVVHYDPPRLNAYPPNFGCEVTRLDQVGLEKEIRQAISLGWSEKYSQLAYRWLATTLLRALIHRNQLEDSATSKESVDEKRLPPESNSQLRHLIPGFIRERVSRSQARKNRLHDFSIKSRSHSAQQGWKKEVEVRLDNLGSGPIWEPLIIQRGVPLEPDLEIASIRSEVMQLIDQLGGLEIYSLRK